MRRKSDLNCKAVEGRRRRETLLFLSTSDLVADKAKSIKGA